jgi:hypothetical protein
MIDTKALREAAEKATPGPWRTEPCGTPNCWCEVVVSDVQDQEECIFPSGSAAKADAQFIAAANPQTVIALLDVVDAARAKKQAVDAFHSAPNLDNCDLAEKFQEMGRLDDQIFLALVALDAERGLEGKK